ncbi:DinB family protein [Ekhidna sp.]|uniref:DinB family protein n=1 Tax=Ekhidna sp. TaxID=2608089 RepID=UPI003BAA2A2C
MTRIPTIILMGVLILFAQCSTTSGTELTKEERDFAINELVSSRDSLLNTINGLSEEQLNFKSNESSWSIAQCMEHITLFENVMFDVLEESLKLPADPERRKDLRFTDSELMAHVSDRTSSTKTTEEFEPTGKYGNHSLTVIEFKDKREKHIEYIRTTTDDLRNHFVNFGSADAYQLLLYMSSHSERHLQQIKQILNNKDFPNN